MRTAEDSRKYPADSGRWEAGWKELAKQKAEGQGHGSSRCQFVENRAERGSLPQGSPKGSAEALATLGIELYAKA